jgi:hypothetical protein
MQRHPSWWANPARRMRMTPAQRLAAREERFVRLRSSTGLQRHRRPGEFSIPGYKVGLVLGVPLGLAAWAFGASALWILASASLGGIALQLLPLIVASLLFRGAGPAPTEPPFDDPPAGQPARQ